MLVSLPPPQVLACTRCQAQFRLAAPKQAPLPPAPVKPVPMARLIHTTTQRRSMSSGRMGLVLGMGACVLATLGLAIGIVIFAVRLGKTPTAQTSSSSSTASSSQLLVAERSSRVSSSLSSSTVSSGRSSSPDTASSSSSASFSVANGSSTSSPESTSSASAGSGSSNPVPPRDKMVLDRYGNPDGEGYSLANRGEFKGKRLLFWSGSKIVMDRFFGDDNPLWKALADRGFEVTRKAGIFQEAWLKDLDQLWICCNPDVAQIDPTLVTVLKELVGSDDLIKLSIEASPANKFPVNADAVADVKAEYQGLFEVAEGQPRITGKGYDAIVRFIESGKGVFIMAENEPYFAEANVLLGRLYKTSINGNYPGEKILYVRERKLPRETIAKYKGDYEIRDHRLLAGVNFIFEGITISHVEPCDKLETAFTASDGQILAAVSKVRGQRVVIDCGYTHYYYGKSELYRPINRAAGTVRFAENVAAYLQAKE
jgi:hypothetical protein